MENQIVYASARDAVVIRFCDTTDACREAIKIHHAKGSAAHALARVLTGAVLGASLMKNDSDRFTLSVNAEGAISHVTATATPAGEVKALIDDQEELLKETVSESFGDGMLRIIKETGVGEPYSGSIQLVSGEIAEDLTAYFAFSEQTPSSCALGEDFDGDTLKRAGGFLIQLMPDTPDEVVDLLEKDLAKSQSVCDMLEAHDSPQELVSALLPGLFPETSLVKDVKFECGCSREKAGQALIAAGKANLEEMISEEKDFPVVCPYCKNEYIFKTEDLKDLLEESSEKE